MKHESVEQHIYELVATGVFDSIADGISIQDTDFKILYQNSTHKLFVGEHTGEYCYKAYEKRSHICEGCPLMMTFKDGLPHTEERTAPTDKGISHFEITASPLRDKTGGIIAGIEVARDITERKKLDDTLRLHSAIMMNMDEGVNLSRASDLTFIYANPKFEEMFGYSSGELIGKHVSVLNAPTGKDSQDISQDILESIKKNNLWKGEIENIRKDGTTFWSFANISMFNHPEYGKVFVSVQTDITERKKAEENVKESERKLSESQKIAKLGHYVFDIKTGIWTSSDTLDDIFGIDRNYKRDINGWLNIVHTDYRETMLNYLQDNVLTQHQKFDKEYKIINIKSGQEKWVHGLGNLKFSNNSHPIEMFGTIHDITERKKLEEEQQRSHTLESIGILAGGIASRIFFSQRWILNVKVKYITDWKLLIKQQKGRQT
jgi:PAS domain S-box-containing protein